MWARQSFTGLHLWDMRTTCAGYSKGRPAICESLNVRGFGGRTLDSPTFHHLRFLGNDARTRHGARCVSAHRGQADEKSDYFSMQPHEASGLCQEPVVHPPFTISILYQFHLVPSVALLQKHHHGSPLQRFGNRGKFYARAASNIQRGNRHFIALPLFFFATQYRGADML